MPKVGTEANAIRVAIIGSGPAGFYAVSYFLKQKGLAVELDIGDVSQGLYTARWIKRGPTGVIGANKTCVQETVGCMLKDLCARKLMSSDVSSRGDLTAIIRSRQPQLVTYEDWQKIDSAEISKGEAEDRTRGKFTSVDEILSVLKG